MSVSSGRRAIEAAALPAFALPDWLPRLAHDVRGPIGPIQMAARMLEGEALSAAQVPELGRSIERQANRLSQLANELDDILRIALGEFGMQLVPNDLRTVVERAVAGASRSAASVGREGRTVVVHERSTSVIVQADGERLAQLIAQLLAAIAPGTPDDAECWIACETVGDVALVRLHDGARRIYRSVSICYLVTGEPPIDPGVLAMAPVIGREIARRHAATIAIGDDGNGRIGELVLRMPLAGVRQ
jgi:signal transduction histidine kinase